MPVGGGDQSLRQQHFLRQLVSLASKQPSASTLTDSLPAGLHTFLEAPQRVEGGRQAQIQAAAAAGGLQAAIWNLRGINASDAVQGEPVDACRLSMQGEWSSKAPLQEAGVQRAGLTGRQQHCWWCRLNQAATKESNKPCLPAAIRR